MIAHQVSDGNWSKGAESTILNFFSDESIQDATIESLIAQAKSVGSKEDPKIIHLTIVALYILKDEFLHKKDEWQLIAKKAKDFLKAAGVENIEMYLKKLDL